MQTCNELLIDCIEFEESEIAHDLIYLLEKGYVNYDSPISNIDWNKVDRNITNEYIKNNILAINIVDLYSCLVYDDNTSSKWLMVFAESLESARGYCLSKLGYIPKIIKMPKEKEFVSFWIPEQRCYKSLWQIKRESFAFPCEVFEYENKKGEWK